LIIAPSLLLLLRCADHLYADCPLAGTIQLHKHHRLQQQQQ
jgi:hypothetical protein